MDMSKQKFPQNRSIQCSLNRMAHEVRQRCNLRADRLAPQNVLLAGNQSCRLSGLSFNKVPRYAIGHKV